MALKFIGTTIAATVATKIAIDFYETKTLRASAAFMTGLIPGAISGGLTYLVFYEMAGFTRPDPSGLAFPAILGLAVGFTNRFQNVPFMTITSVQ
jgi:hypothetical protein